MFRNLTRRLKVDPGLIVVALLATLAAWPFLTRPSLPTYTDAESHVYRTYEIMSAWKQGVPYLRWAPDLVYGYGYPVFNYYSPLTHYLGAAYGWLCCDVNTGPVAGVKFVLVISAYIGALGMYLFGRDQWGQVAGLVSAATYVFSPYIVYTNPHWRGASPEMFAIALGPMLLWAFARLRRSASPGNLALAALMLAVLVLSHNLMSFVLLGLAGGWVIWEIVLAWIRPATSPPLVNAGWHQSLWPLGAAIFLGMSLSAFMWLPATVERTVVQFQKAFVIQPQDHLIEARELFAPATMDDILGPTLPPGGTFKVGIIQSVLSLLGVLTLGSTRLRQRATLFFVAATAAMICFMLPLSATAWKMISSLAYLQFPSRLLGPTAIGLGVLAGAAVSWTTYLPKEWGQVVFGFVAVMATIATAMPLLDPLPWADYGPVTLRRILIYELNGNIGTTGQNEFLPATVIDLPKPQEALLQSYDATSIDKVNQAALPPAAQAVAAEHGPEHDRFQVTAPTDFDLQIFTFYFPGWIAYIDGVKVPITISKPEGFITVRVPAGVHDVLLRFEDTSPRRLGWAISGLGAMTVLALIVRQLRHKRLSSTPLTVEPVTWRSTLAFGALVLVGMGVRYAADRTSPWQVSLPSLAVPEAQQQHFVRLENNMALLAYDLPHVTAHPGDSVPLTLYWKAMAHVPLNLSVFVHFVGPDGQLWGQSDKLVPADFLPTGRWPLNRYLPDAHAATLHPDAPPGDYQVIVGLWDRTTGTRMHMLAPNGAVMEADGITLTTHFVVQSH